jgi:hypothetical protein
MQGRILLILWRVVGLFLGAPFKPTREPPLLILRRPAYGFLLFLAAVAAPLALEGCAPDCSAVGLFCEGDVLVACVSQGYYPAQLERTEYPCAAGEQCVSNSHYAACAVRDPACVATSYCKEDRVVTCQPGFPGYATEETACSPYPCVQVEGGDGVCADPSTECFKLPDGQHCSEYNGNAIECWQRGRVREKLCKDCDIDPDGKAMSKETNAPCL